MRVDSALLCDWASVREGLLHVLGGGLTRLWRSEFPAPLGAALAIRIVVHPTEADAHHDFKVLLLAEDGEEVARLEGAFDPDGETKTDLPGEEVAANIALPMPNIGLPCQGHYSFEVLIDGVHQRSVPFWAGPRPTGS